MMSLEQCKAEPCVFCRLVNGKVELMVGIHVGDIFVLGEKGACDKFLEELRQRFVVKNQGELKMYSGWHSYESGNQVSWR